MEGRLSKQMVWVQVVRHTQPKAESSASMTAIAFVHPPQKSMPDEGTICQAKN
jgi:hypothetical protein